MVIDTAFTRALGVPFPIVQAPMGGAAGPRLVAAVAEAGALGVLPIWSMSPRAAAEAIEATRAMTGARFAVNLRADLAMHDHIAAAADRGVDLVHLFWGDPAASAATVRRCGAALIVTVSDADTTKAALDAGAAALLAQGVEAGGHVFGTTPLADLVQLVADLAGPVPVIAAGGLSGAEDALEAFRLGASAVAYGTRFLATEESDAHPDYKAAVLAADEGQTVHTLCFDGWWPDAPHRVLRNSTFIRWEAAGRPPPGARPGEGDAVLRTPRGDPIPRYHAALPQVGMTGDCEAAALYAGAGVGRIGDIVSAAGFIRAVAAQLDAALAS